MAALLVAPGAEAAPLLDGPVVGGAFGAGGADYFGEVRDRGASEAARPRPARGRARAAAGRPAHAPRDGTASRP